MMKKVDLVIIGGGPAGLASAIYAGRAGFKTVVIEKAAPGGKLNNTHKIDNYPGMEGKAGWEFSMSFSEQAKNFGAEIIGGEVIEIRDLDSKLEKHVELSNGDIFQTKAIIIAAGLKPKVLNVPGYYEYFGKGVSTCVVCDGAFYRGKDIAIIGGGNAATEESLFAAGIVNKAYIINSFSSFRAEKDTLDKLETLENIETKHNTDVLEIIGEGERVSALKILEKDTNEEKILDVSGVFTYVGWDVENYFIKDQEMFDEEGFIIVNGNTETKYPGVYAAGDIVAKPFRQVTIAVSEGTWSALSAVNYLNKI